MFGCTFLFIKKVGNPQIDGPAVYCANHTSYMDIPTLFLTVPGFFKIIGKAELNKAPLFGFYFKRVYISVDRKDSQSRYQAYLDCVNTVKNGDSIVFFPEGTIPRDGAPQMINFKDGPFKTAIENQVPIVPVTLPYNWIIFPGSTISTWATWKRPYAEFHEPISTIGMTVENDLESLKQQTFDVISKGIEKYNS